MAKPLKTVFLLEDLCFGGTQKQNLALALRLDRERFEPAILTLTGPTDLDADAINGNVKVEHIGASRAVAPFFFARLGKCLARLKPDILVPCTALPNIWGRLWGRWQKIPVIVGTVRGGGAPKRQHEWLLWRLANGIVCNSLPLRDIMLKLGCSETRYIPNGVDFGHFTPATQKQPGKTIVCVARLAKDKDHPTLLGAFAKILRKIPDAKLRFIGEGPEENSLKNLAAQIFSASQAGRVEFAGASHDPAPALAQADIFALSSIREGQPNVILEAMACGLPVCATNVGGIPDLVRDNGLLCEPGDCETLAANLTRLLENPEEGRAMGQAGRNRVERDFSFKSMAQRHEEFFLYLWEQTQTGKKR